MLNSSSIWRKKNVKVFLHFRLTFLSHAPQYPPNYHHEKIFSVVFMCTIKIKVHRTDSGCCCQIWFVLISDVILQPCTLIVSDKCSSIQVGSKYWGSCLGIYLTYGFLGVIQKVLLFIQFTSLATWLLNSFLQVLLFTPQFGVFLMLL